MRKSITTEEDIEWLLDYVVGESYGSYYYDRVRNSSNVILMGKYLKLMTRIKGSDFAERMQVYKEMEQVLQEIKNDEYIEDVNTFEWVKDMLMDAGVVKAIPDNGSGGMCKIIPLFSEEDT
ncbi:MAG: hypothetical protein ACI4FZ_04490 [Lachnospiraceae bacterium]